VATTALAALALAGHVASASPATPGTTPAPLLAAAGQSVISARYVIVLRGTPAGRNAPPAADAVGRARAHGVLVDREYRNALSGFAAALSADQLAAVRRDPDVAYVEADRTVRLDNVQSPVGSWGLDRVDQRNRPLDNVYVDNANGAGVTAFVIDSGIRATHAEFGGRVAAGADFVGDGNGTDDCLGHGTHVAGTIGGSTFGVAKAVSLVPVRVFGCSSSAPISRIISGVDWVTAHHGGPSVANMSLGGGTDDGLDSAVSNSINSGVVYAVAAGNSHSDACGTSPARVQTAITVGATNSNDSRDTNYSNFGSCLTLFAPGTGITSAGISSDTDTAVMSGTSMATPHVTGVAALYLQEARSTPPATIKRWIVDAATRDVLTDIGNGSPNRLLYAPAVFGSSVALARNGDGRLQVMGTNSADGVFQRWQINPGGPTGWTGWSGPFFTGQRSVAAEVDANGLLEMFVVDTFGHVYYAKQLDAANDWGGVRLFDGALASIAAARNADGRLEIFGANAAGQVFHRLQASPGNWDGSGWQQFDGALSQVAAETNADGRVELFGVNTAGMIFHRAQTSPGDWTGSSWSQLPGLLMSIAATRNADGRLEIFGTNAAGQVFNAWQQTPGGVWSNWNEFGGELRQITAETNLDGRIEVFGVDGDGAVFLRWQQTAGGNWSGWSAFDGQLRP
jgi:subtilisin family serine protease